MLNTMESYLYWLRIYFIRKRESCSLPYCASFVILMYVVCYVIQELFSLRLHLHGPVNEVWCHQHLHPPGFVTLGSYFQDVDEEMSALEKEVWAWFYWPTKQHSPLTQDYGLDRLFQCVLGVGRGLFFTTCFLMWM